MDAGAMTYDMTNASATGDGGVFAVNISLLAPEADISTTVTWGGGGAGGGGSGLLEEGEACAGSWVASNHVLYQLAHGAMLLAFMAPNTMHGFLFMHSTCVLGFLLLSSWSWAMLCAPDIFSWNFSFTIINIVQLFFILYELRPAKFAGELEDVYATLFEPMKVNRNLFKKLVSPEYCSLLTLSQGEVYATQEVTRTDKLGLLLCGTANVTSHGQFLHCIMEKQFLDSPEFESATHVEEKYHVSIMAATTCRYIFWQRPTLEYLFAKEPYLCTVMGYILGRDITDKLYLLNERLRSPRGGRVDVRLPNVNSAALSGVDLRAMSSDSRQLVPSMAGDLASDSDPDEEDLLEELNEKMPMFPNGVPHSRLHLQLSNSTYSSVSSAR